MFFAFFYHFSSTFNLLFLRFPFFSRTFASEKNKRVNLQRIQDSTNLWCATSPLGVGLLY